MPPPLPFLFRKGDALDIRPCWRAGRAQVRAAVAGAADIKLLWAVTSIPDFGGRSLNDNHYDMLANLF